MEAVVDGSPKACLTKAFDHLKHDLAVRWSSRTSSSLERRWGERTMIEQRRREHACR
jgi:hypothetical protein